MKTRGLPTYVLTTGLSFGAGLAPLYGLSPHDVEAKEHEIHLDMPNSGTPAVPSYVSWSSAAMTTSAGPATLWKTEFEELLNSLDKLDPHDKFWLE